jgi:hypothetical protein
MARDYSYKHDPAQSKIAISSDPEITSLLVASELALARRRLYRGPPNSKRKLAQPREPEKRFLHVDRLARRKNVPLASSWIEAVSVLVVSLSRATFANTRTSASASTPFPHSGA